MKAVLKIKPGKGNIEIKNVDLPKISENDVLIKITKAGICGTDYHIYSWDHWSEGRMFPPLIIGHEFAGIVEAKGEKVSTLHIGQRVTAEGHIVCNNCKSCSDGNFHICDNVKIIGVDRNGCFAEYLSMPAYNVWPLKDKIADKYGAIMDPLGNAMHTVTVQSVKDRNVFISGAGSIGLFATSIALHMGARNIMVSEPNAGKRNIAKQLGASSVVDPLEKNVKERVLSFFGGHGPDVVLEMSGYPSAISLAFDVIAKGGDMAMLGLPPDKIALDISNNIIFKGLTVRGVSGRRMYETWNQCDDFLLNHSSDIDPVITHDIPMSEISKGFKMMENNEAIKVLLSL